MKWTRKPLESVADFCLGKMLDQKKNKGELLPYLANLNVRWGSFDLENLREMRFEDRELDRYGLKHGDIVMCEGGEPGRCAVWKEQGTRMMFQKALHRIRPRECLSSEFLFYSLLHKGRTGRLAPLFTGATIKHLPREKLAMVDVEIPPLPVQHRIAATLSAYDDLIENNRRRMKLLEDAARLLYQEWFVRLRFPGHERIRVRDGVPEGWDRKTLGDLCVEVRETVAPESVEPDTPYIGLEHIPRRSISLTEWSEAEVVTSTKHKFLRGDILFGKIRPYFHKVGIAFTDGVASSDAIVIRPDSADLRSFVLMTVSSDGFVAEVSQAMKEGSKMPRADCKQMMQHILAVPPEGLLVSFSETVTAMTDQLRTLCFQNRKLGAARDLLLPRLMSGEVTMGLNTKGEALEN